MTHVKIIEYRARPATKRRDRAAENMRVTIRSGGNIGGPISNVKATSISLREGSRACWPADSGTGPENCFYCKTLPGSYQNDTPAFPGQWADYKRNCCTGIGSLSIQMSGSGASSQGKRERLSYHGAILTRPGLEQLLVQFQGMIAEYERAQIAERTKTL